MAKEYLIVKGRRYLGDSSVMLDTASSMATIIFGTYSRSYPTTCPSAGFISRPKRWKQLKRELHMKRASQRGEGENSNGKKKYFTTMMHETRVLGGAKALYDAVKVTYGPKGRNVVIAKGYGGPTVTHDGVTVAEGVELPENDDETLGYKVGSRAYQASC
jgi:hypothetical protein